MALTCSSSICRIRFQSSSFETSMLVCDSPFLYSSGQSSRIILGFSILRRILGCVMSLFSMTPSSTLLSSISPPGTFSMRAYRLMSTSFLPLPASQLTVRTALSARLHMRSDHRETNLVPIEDEMRLYMALSSLMSIGVEISSMISRASARARLKAAMMTTGWMLRSSWGRAWARISPARMMTVVVPSPTSSSCVRLSSIMLLAAGCDTSISRRMAWPSFVRTMPPMGSSSIFSMALGPKHDRMMSATLGGENGKLVAVGCCDMVELLTSSRPRYLTAELSFRSASHRSGCLQSSKH
jgi:hypothetical protein